MGGRGLLKEQVYEAARALVSQNKKLTSDSVRDYLGTGSKSTIHKYLTKWKEEKYRGVGDDKVSNDKLIELEEELAKQSKLNQKIFAEKIELQKSFFALDTEHQELLEENQLNKHQINNLQLQVESLNMAIAEITKERETAIQAIIEDKNKMIESLTQELKQIHISSLELIQKASSDAHEELMELKVKNINLKEQISALKNKNLNSRLKGEFLK